jgi:hypothetical protein
MILRNGLALAAAVLLALSAAGRAETVELDGLKSKAPESWKFVEPKNPPGFQARVYQANLPKAEGDTDAPELVVFYFGKGSGGSADDNIKRQYNKFEFPEGKTGADVADIKKFKVGDVPVTYLDVTGTFLVKFPPFAPNARVTDRKKNYRLLYVVFESPNGPYFVQVTGPGKSVEALKEGFDAWLKNFK